MYIVFGFLVRLRSSFIRKSGRTRVWAKGSEPQGGDHHQTSGPGPAWLEPEQEAASNSQARKSWRGSQVMQPEANRLGEVRAEQGLSGLTGQKLGPGPAFSCEQASVKQLYSRHCL